MDLDDEKSNQLNAEQLAQLQQAFKEFDNNDDNFITTKELGWTMRLMGFNPTELELQQLVNRVMCSINIRLKLRLSVKYDTDGSGKIEFPEF